MESGVREELSALVAAFADRLQWQLHHGAWGAPTSSSPRLSRPDSQTAPDPKPPDAATPAATSDLAAPTLEQVRADLGDCRRCPLAAGRKQIVFGEGAPDSEVMFVGEGPGADEDASGHPFVGKAGQLLTRMIQAMGLERDEVYIANIVKCRPPNNRDPQPGEIEACEPFLRLQIDAIGPRMIIALGGFAAKTLLRTETGISQLRGRFHTYHGTPLMPTFHPAFLLRNPERKRPVWEDLKQVMAEMDRLGLNRRRG